MKIFKGKYAKAEQGDKCKKYASKSFRKTGKKLEQYDPWTVFVPLYNKCNYWWD